MAYTYLVGWSYLNLWYYGFRGAKNCDPIELMVTYHTSSTRVHQLVKEHGTPDVIQIRKVFDTSEEAFLWESRVLRKMKVSSKREWVNAHENYPCSPFGSIHYKNMLIKLHGVSNANQIPKVKQAVSQKLKGRMAAYNIDTGLVEYISKDVYQSNKEKYLHTSSYAYRAVIGVHGKQTKDFSNQPPTSIWYDTETKKTVKLNSTQKLPKHISVNSKEYTLLLGKKRKPNKSLSGKEYVIDLQEEKMVHADISTRKLNPVRYVHINSLKGREFRKNAQHHKTLSEPLGQS
jgi:hypothetical protein